MSTRRSDDRNRKVVELGLKPIRILLLSTVVGAAVLAAPVWAQGHTDTTDGHSGSGGAGGGHDSTDSTDHGAGGPGGPSGSGGGHDGSDGDDHDTEEGHSGGQGAGGQGGGGQGGQAGNGQGRGQGGSGNSGGGRPVWAQEGLPQVELGRLNVGRSPDRVIDRAFDEALSGFTEDVAEFYRLNLEQMEDAVVHALGGRESHRLAFAEPRPLSRRSGRHVGFARRGHHDRYGYLACGLSWDRIRQGASLSLRPPCRPSQS